MICLTGRSDINAPFYDQMNGNTARRLIAQAFMNSTSSEVTSSPTTMPPVSSTAFQVKPKSLRLIFVVAEIAIRVLPQDPSSLALALELQTSPCG